MIDLEVLKGEDLGNIVAVYANYDDVNPIGGASLLGKYGTLTGGTWQTYTSGRLDYMSNKNIQQYLDENYNTNLNGIPYSYLYEFSRTLYPETKNGGRFRCDIYSLAVSYSVGIWDIGDDNNVIIVEKAGDKVYVQSKYIYEDEYREPISLRRIDGNFSFSQLFDCGVNYSDYIFDGNGIRIETSEITLNEEGLVWRYNGIPSGVLTDSMFDVVYIEMDDIADGQFANFKKIVLSPDRNIASIGKNSFEGVELYVYNNNNVALASTCTVEEYAFKDAVIRCNINFSDGILLNGVGTFYGAEIIGDITVSNMCEVVNSMFENTSGQLDKLIIYTSSTVTNCRNIVKNSSVDNIYIYYNEDYSYGFDLSTDNNNRYNFVGNKHNISDIIFDNGVVVADLVGIVLNGTNKFMNVKMYADSADTDGQSGVFIIINNKLCKIYEDGGGSPIGIVINDRVKYIDPFMDWKFVRW